MAPGRAVLATLVAIGLLATGGTALWQARTLSAERAVTSAAPKAPAPRRDAGVAILRAWDTQRAAAYEAGDVNGLRALYARGSTAGRRDVRLLRRYAARGLRVSGLETQLLAVRVKAGSEAAGRLVLEVTDRVAGAVAVRGSTRVPLPAGAARGRLVTLVDRDGRWVVSTVRAATPR
jgi:hypothetical protein